VILVGSPGSGKSAFAKQLIDLGWVCVQPDQGSQQLCKKKFLQALKQGNALLEIMLKIFQEKV
jgi:dephospho-CoA kinase